MTISDTGDVQTLLKGTVPLTSNSELTLLECYEIARGLNETLTTF